MADETKSYRIDFSSPPAKIERDLAKIDAALAKTQASITKTAGMLKALGQNTPGIPKTVAELKKLDIELKAKVTDSTRAEAALKKIGADNKALTAMTARVAKMSAELKLVTAEALAAKAALAGVGGGGGSGGGAGGGGGVVVVPPGGVGKTPAGKPKAGLGGVGTMAAMAGAMVLRAGIHEAAEGAQKGRDYFTAATGKVTDLRDSAREFASLRKQPGPNDQILREITGFAKATGATSEDAVKFLTTYEGSATTGRDKGNIGGVVGKNGYTQPQQDALEAKLKVVGGQFAMKAGLDARTAGDLTAVISTYKKINNEADMAGQLAGAHYGIDQGRGEISPLARAELAQAGSAIESNRVGGLPELGAFIGVASVVAKTPGSSGTTYGQISRLLNESGQDNEDQAAFIKESGVGAAKGDLNKIKALRDHLAKVKPDDANTYLESKGYGNSTDRKSLLGVVGNVDVLEARIKKANEIANDGQAALARNAENQREISVVGARARANDFEVDIEAGIQNEKLETGRTSALSRLKDPRQPGGPQIYTPRASLVDATRSFFMAFSNTGGAERIDEEAIEGLRRGGEQVGVDVAKEFPKLMRTGITGRDASTDTARRELYGQAYDLVTSKGGDPLGGAPTDAAKALRKAADALDAMKLGKQGGGGGRPPVPSMNLPSGQGNYPGRP
jgi:hypothetical protein